MEKFDESLLSDKMKEDVAKYRKSGEDAIYIMGHGLPATTESLITRMQAVDIERITSDESSIKTMDEWRDADKMLTSVRSTLAPITKQDEVAKFSSYALMENNYGKLRYPLMTSLVSDKILFSKKTFPTYNELIDKVRKAYKVKITERSDNGPLFTYKKSFKVFAMLKNAGLGVLNLCRKVFKMKPLRTAPSYRGKMSINSTLDGYQISEQEKFTKVMDAIADVTVKNVAKNLGSKLDNKALFVSRLYAGVLVSRAINYGDVLTNQNVEDSLTLQMSNALAGLNLTSDQIKEVSKIGLESAMSMVRKLEIPLEQVIKSVKAAGYTYEGGEPTTLKEALLPKYFEIVYDKPKTQEKSAEKVTEKVAEKAKVKARAKKTTKTTTKSGVASRNKPKKAEAVAVADAEVVDDSEVVNRGYNPNFILVHDTPTRPDPANAIDAEITPKSLPDPTKYPLIEEKKELVGVKEDPSNMVTIKSVKKYIDAVVKSNLKKHIRKSINDMNTHVRESKISLYNRQYDFVEHMYTFYDQHKDQDAATLNAVIEEELAKAGSNDNNYAHSFGKSFIDLRQKIVEDLFAGKVKVETEGDVATLVNKYMKENYYADSPRTSSLLSSYVAESVSSRLKTLFQKIDNKEFEPVNLIKQSEKA